MRFAYSKAPRCVVPSVHILFNADTESPNLFLLANQPVKPALITVLIEAGVTVFSDNTANPAMIVGAFAPGTEIRLVNEGTIEAAAGVGGAGGAFEVDAYGGGYGGGHVIDYPPSVGAPAGDAIQHTAFVTLIITNEDGYIYGGGGGGGGSGGGSQGPQGAYAATHAANGGGGGAGHQNASGGAAGYVSGLPLGACSHGGTCENFSTECPGLVGLVGGAVGGAGRAGDTTWAKDASCNIQMTASSGASGAGGGYGEAGGAGAGGFQSCWLVCGWAITQAGAAGGAAGKAIDKNGGVVQWLSGNTAARVKGVQT